MLWEILAISVGFVWAVVNVIDKFVVSKLVKNPLIPLVFLGTIGAIAAIAVYFTVGFAYLSLVNIALALLVGAFFMFTSILFLKSLDIEEVSRVNSLFLVSPIYTLIFAALFLGEILPLRKYAGFFLLVGGAVLISMKGISKIKLRKAFWYMMAADLFVAVSAVLTKYLLRFSDYWTIFSYSRIGFLIVLVPILYYIYPELLSLVKKNGIKLVATTSISELLNVFGILLLVAATSLGPVTLVSAFTSLQPFFVFAIAYVLTTFYPHIIKENISRKIILTKVGAIAMLFIGAVLAV